jgi:hypothetical protein
VSVVVRIGSPGSDGAIGQINRSTADGDTAHATTTGADNLAVTVVIPSTLPVVVGDTWVWDWNWASGPLPTGQDAAPTATGVWDWSWGTPTATQSAPGTPVAGHWIWTWTWTRGDGWSQTLSTDQPCSCSWLWSWTWTWNAPVAAGAAPSGAPAVDVPDAALATAADTPQVAQSNEANATATATADLASVQTVDRTGTDDLAGDAAATQTLASAQNADAAARAEQVDVVNSSWVSAGTLDAITQANTIEAAAEASAALDAVQAIVQSRQRTTDDETALSLAAAQSIASSQDASADAEGVQNRVFNVSAVWSQAPSTAPIGAIGQSNEANAAAAAVVTGSVEQQIVQMQVEAGSVQTVAAAQSAANAQSADSSAGAAQSDVGNVNDVEIPAYGVFNPAVTTSNTASATSSMTDTSTFRQSALQAAAGENIEWHEQAGQEAQVTQSGDSSASQAQAFRVNRTGWTGPIVFPSAPQAQASAPEAEQAASEVSALAAPVVGETVAFARRKPFWSPPGGTAPTAKKAKPKLVVTTFGLRLATPAPAPMATPFIASLPSLGAPPQAPAAAITFSDVHDPSFDGPDSAGGVAPVPGERGPCPQCKDGFLGGLIIGSAQGPSSGGLFAALEPYRIFAAPGVGRPLPAAPALGLPVDLAPPERPG